MGSVRSRTTSQRRGGIALAAFGLLLGLGIAAPAGAQDGGESYTTSGPTDRDTDGNGIPDDIEQGILGGDLSRCSPVSYTVGESFELEVPGPVDGNSSFVLNQYSQSLQLFVGTAPTGSVEVTSPLAGEHTLIFYGVDADGNEAAAGIAVRQHGIVFRFDRIGYRWHARCERFRHHRRVGYTAGEHRFRRRPAVVAGDRSSGCWRPADDHRRTAPSHQLSVASRLNASTPQR